jgi:hypothetical protein
MSRRKKSSSSSRRSGSSRNRPTRRCTTETPPLKPSKRTNTPGFTPRSYEVGTLRRLRLEERLRQYLPRDDSRGASPTSRVLLVLAHNVLFSREPVYAVGQWTARSAPDVFALWIGEVSLLQHDRLGRRLARLFAEAGPELIRAVVRHVMDTFPVRLDELHNDSASLSFSGAYENAAEEGRRDGRVTRAITWRYCKDDRPELR